MNYLQYKSNEMYSSTQLIRKSKLIFDKIESKEIEKAVILRDGKPSFILMDFELYENIMNEYIQLKEKKEKLFSQEIKQENSNIEVNKLQENEHQSSDQDSLLKKLDSIEGVINNDTNIKSDNLKEFWE